MRAGVDGLDLRAYSLSRADLARLEQAHESAGGAAAAAGRGGLLALRTALAWQLRQRDTARALALAESVASAAALPLALQARLALVRGEAAWLQADLGAAEAQALQAERLLGESLELPGLSDSAMLLAMVAFERGDWARGVEQLQRVRDLHGDAGRAGADRLRHATASAMQAYWRISGEIEAAQADALAILPEWRALACPTVTLWCDDIEAQIHYRRGRYDQAIRAFEEVHHGGIEAGQIRRSILACANVATCYVTLNDHYSALGWVESGLALARPGGWPGPMGSCLLLLGRVLSRLGRLEAADQALAEARRTLHPLAGSRTDLAARFYAGELALQRNEPGNAAELLAGVLESSLGGGQVDLAQMARVALARALGRLGQMDAAHAHALTALRQAEEESPALQIDALVLLAELRRSRDAESPALDSDTGSSPLALLQRALELSEATPGLALDPGLCDSLAQEHARAGDTASAYRLALRAGQARDERRRLEAGQQAIALAAYTDIERTRAEREQMRAERDSSVQRASLLEGTYRTLSQLGHIGREIVSDLSTQAVFARIHRHLSSLLDGPGLAVWMMEESTQSLRLGYEHGGAQADTRNWLQEAASSCRQADQEQVLSLSLGRQADASGPGAGAPGTAMLGPLRARDRVIGVLAVHTPKTAAYGDRERLIFRSLCAYGALALDNALAYQELERARTSIAQAASREAQARREAEEAARLKGEFLSHVSQALRKPLAVLHRRLLQAQSLDLHVAGNDALASLGKALRRSERVNVLARELLQLARMESHAVELQREPFALAELVQDVVHQQEPRARRRGRTLRVEFPSRALEVHADIAMIERVLRTLIDHSLRRTPTGGEVVLRFAHAAHGPVVEIADGGTTLDADTVAGLFGRPAQGSRSLGLPLVREMLRLHGCEIHGHPRPEGGLALRFDLPGLPS